jgi:hypothetical protein
MDGTEEGDEIPVDGEAWGRQMLQSFGWKDGQPLRDGGRVEQYVPSVVGGFPSGGGKTNVESENRVGNIVVVEGAACEILRTDGNNAEVEFADGSRRKIVASLMKAAGAVDREVFSQAKQTSGSRISWITPRLLVRVVAGEDGLPVEPYKATVVRVDHAGNRVLLNNGRTVQPECCDTVLPKIGEKGLVVVGPRRGSIGTLEEKLKNGATVTLIVRFGPSDTAKLSPEEISVVAP